MKFKRTDDLPNDTELLKGAAASPGCTRDWQRKQPRKQNLCCATTVLQGPEELPKREL